MKIKFKKLSESAKKPFNANPGDAGYDLYATGMSYHNAYTQYNTGLAIEIPVGYVGLVFPRSSISTKFMSLANAVAVIDSKFQGEILIRMRRITNDPDYHYKVGDKIAQLVVVKHEELEFEEVEDFENETERGKKGFGSSGD